MAYMEFPGVEYTEKDWDSSSAIVGGATDTCGVTIIAQKGPINKPTLVNSIDQAIEKFGTYLANANGMYSIRGFFKNGGRSLYINRVCHYSDITDASTCSARRATASANDRRQTGAEATLTISDKWLGSLGNTYGYKVVDEHRVEVALTAATTQGAKEVTLKVVRDFVVGDYVAITDGTNTSYGKIVSIDIVNKKITLDRALTNVFALTANPKCYTCDFKLQIYRKTLTQDVLEKEFAGCNMDPESAYYVENLVNSSANGSSLVTVFDEQIDVDNIWEKLPVANDVIVYLTGGDDGLTDFADTDIIGDPASKTGLYAFDDIHEMMHHWCPESTSMAVTRASYDYWTNKMTGMYFAAVPSGLNPEAAANFRDEAGWNTSYGTLYHNFGYVLDPIGSGDNPQKLIPLIGHVLGALAKNDRTDVNEYGSAPAGEKMVLVDVNALEFEVNDKNGGIMYGNNNRNINPIVNLSGNGGIAVWGSRTQSSVKKWFQIHARRVFIYAETTIVSQTRWIAFRNKDETLYNQINRRVKKFLGTLQGLDGATDDERFEFVCDTTINDPEDSYVIGRVGLNIVSVAEFVWFEFGQKPEGVSLAEI